MCVSLPPRAATCGAVKELEFLGPLVPNGIPRSKRLLCLFDLFVLVICAAPSAFALLLLPKIRKGIIYVFRYIFLSSGEREKRKDQLLDLQKSKQERTDSELQNLRQVSL